MQGKDLLDWFPEGQVLDHPLEQEGFLSLPFSADHWFVVEEKKLSEREQQLIALLTQKEQVASLNPWYASLIEGKSQLPLPIKKLQLVYCHLSHFQQENLSGWQDMMRSLFPNCLSLVQVGAQDYLFVLGQDKYTSVYPILTDTLEAVEYDFGVRMSLLLGQVWSVSPLHSLVELIQAERDLFKRWWRQGHHGVQRFSQLYLWSLGEQVVDLHVVTACLHQLILEQDQIREIIVSLWDNSAVLTKAAQQLYLHRNSLQYKIEKWEELTGLSLKDLTDLTLCYQLILPDVL